MYLLKQVKVNNFEEKIEEFNGIKFHYLERDIQYCEISDCFYSFLLAIKPNISAEFEYEEEQNSYRATYANSYELNKEILGKELVLNVGAKEEKNDGYIIFIEYLYDAKTDGKIIKGDLSAMVVLLEEGNYIEFTLEEKGKKIIKMIDGKLLMSM